MALPLFRRVTVHDAPIANGSALETEWLAGAARTGEAQAHVWAAPPGLVVPRSYERLPRFVAACAASAAAGWPVQVRSSGGGLVPQGPGVLNLSLVWRTADAAPTQTDAVYRDLCDALADALARLEVFASAQPVEGSFCDGRFNLAVGGRKVAGTAQAWRRVERTPVVLAHAVLIASADPDDLTEVANRFEDLAASARHYRADAVTSVARAWSAAHAMRVAPADLDAQLAAELAKRFAEA